jgi:hypothetical protein
MCCGILQEEALDEMTAAPAKVNLIQMSKLHEAFFDIA